MNFLFVKQKKNIKTYDQLIILKFSALIFFLKNRVNIFNWTLYVY